MATMTDVLLMIVIFGGVFLTLGLVILGFTLSKKEKMVKQRVASDIQAVLQKDDVVEGLNIGQDKKVKDDFSTRIIVPFTQNLSTFVQKVIPISGKSWIREKLVHAGYPKITHFRTFMGVQALAVFCPSGFILFLTFVSKTFPLHMALLALGIFGFFGLALPLLWLLDKSGKRKQAIQKTIPDFLDLLVISVEAGLGLDMAIKKIAGIESMQSSKDLRGELVRYTSDLNLGKSRKEALLGMSERTGVEDLTNIANALIQAFEMGTGVAQTLKIQSEDLRNKRLMRAETQANKISTKMVLPTYLFFFPGIFIVALGPMIYDAVGKMASMRAGG